MRELFFLMGKKYSKDHMLPGKMRGEAEGDPAGEREGMVGRHL